MCVNREMKLLASLKHPNVIGLIEVTNNSQVNYLPK